MQLYGIQLLVMEKFGGTRYNSMWDGSTWLIIGLTVACCLIPCFIDHSLLLITITVGLAILAFILLGLIGTYYRIDGNKLVVYSLFIPTAYPIDKIKEIKPTKSMLSAPAISLSHRLAITFTDRKILKSYIPLIISPVRQEEFIRQLLDINPQIRH